MGDLREPLHYTTTITYTFTKNGKSIVSLLQVYISWKSVKFFIQWWLPFLDFEKPKFPTGASCKKWNYISCLEIERHIENNNKN